MTERRRRGIANFLSDKGVRDRVRRLPSDSALRRLAKRKVKENDLFGALDAMVANGDAHQQHIRAFTKWLDAQDEDELA